MSYKAALFALLALCLHQGATLKCYSCNSATDPMCMDKVEGMQLTQCTPDLFRQSATWLKDTLTAGQGLLGKIGIDTGDVPEVDSAFACVKAVRQDGDKKIVLRSCSVPKNEKFDYCQQLKAQNAMGVTSCDICDTDGCNGASGVAPSALFLLVAALATLLARQ